MKEIPSKWNRIANTSKRVRVGDFAAAPNLQDRSMDTRKLDRFFSVCIVQLSKS